MPPKKSTSVKDNAVAVGAKKPVGRPATKKAASEGATGGPSKKKAKKSADGPKRPPSAYLLFSMEMREQVKREREAAGESIKSTALMSALGAKWKETKDRSVTVH